MKIDCALADSDDWKILRWKKNGNPSSVYACAFVPGGKVAVSGNLCLALSPWLLPAGLSSLNIAHQLHCAEYLRSLAQAGMTNSSDSGTLPLAKRNSILSRVIRFVCALCTIMQRERERGEGGGGECVWLMCTCMTVRTRHVWLMRTLYMYDGANTVRSHP
jgi:hypothetical protein